MRHTLLLAGQFLTASLLLAIGFGASGCGDSATVNPEVALSRLTVSPGTLQPNFSAGTTEYRVDLTSSTTSVTVSAQPAVSGDSVTINGQATTSRVITLEPPGSTTVVNIVVSESNTSSRTYTVRLVRAGLAGNNSLESLAVSPGTLAPDFEPNALPYTVTVPNNVENVDVTPTTQDSNATMTVNGQAATSGQARTITLNGPGQSTTITITVTAQNGTPKTYLVTVSRGISANNNLQSLTVSPGTLTPAFNASAESYTVNVASNVTSVTVRPTLADATATMTVNGQAANSGEARPITLNGPGSTTIINILVIAQNSNSKTYSVNVVRQALGGNNSLSALSVSPGTLNPAFDANTLDYTVNVASTVGSVSITPTREDPNATITVNGQTATSGQARSITLNPAGQSTTIRVIVTAQNGNQKTYLVTVSRAPLGGNNNLQSLAVSPGSLAPAFNANTTSYSVDVGSSVSSVTVTPRLQDTAATMTVNGQATNSGQARTITLNGAGSNTLINIVVTAPNNTQKTYTVNVRRAALGGNNNLSALTISPGSLAPAFSANTTSYSVDVESGVTNISVTPTLSDPAATMTVNGQSTNSGQTRTITLNGAGSNTLINIVVTAPNNTQKTYTITVNRAAPASNNNLSALGVTPGSLAPNFAAGTLNYTANVATDVTEVTIAATKSDPNAVMSGSVTAGTGVATGQATIPLNGAGTSTSVSITVTAPNGTSKTYTITVNREAPAAPAAPPTPASAPDLIPEDDSCPLLDPPDPTNPDPDGCAPGTSKSDNITNVNTPRFRIAQPAAGQTPNLYVDGARVDSTFNPAANTLTPTAALSDGEHQITYTVTNAGGESGPSPALTVTINTGAPGAPTP